MDSFPELATWAKVDRAIPNQDRLDAERLGVISHIGREAKTMSLGDMVDLGLVTQDFANELAQGNLVD